MYSNLREGHLVLRRNKINKDGGNLLAEVDLGVVGQRCVEQSAQVFLGIQEFVSLSLFGDLVEVSIGFGLSLHEFDFSLDGGSLLLGFLLCCQLVRAEDNRLTLDFLLSVDERYIRVLSGLDDGYVGILSN